MTARIYQPTKTAMQSGRAKTQAWVLEFERRTASTIDPLMGWTSSADMVADQVRLTFATREQAESYARRQGIDYVVDEPGTRTVRPKSYASNFRWNRPD
ncbi:MAG: ETC complex I subunit [Alphaproteobacteria bacterium]